MDAVHESSRRTLMEGMESICGADRAVSSLGWWRMASMLRPRGVPLDHG